MELHYYFLAFETTWLHDNTPRIICGNYFYVGASGCFGGYTSLFCVVVAAVLGRFGGCIGKFVLVVAANSDNFSDICRALADALACSARL